MSAGICIMNRNAIAMAADSAVTVGDHAAIHNSANKLFSLSRVAPVGVIVYANAALMTVPIEIIVKQYKKQLADRVFPIILLRMWRYQKALQLPSPRLLRPM